MNETKLTKRQQSAIAKKERQNKVAELVDSYIDVIEHIWDSVLDQFYKSSAPINEEDEEPAGAFQAFIKLCARLMDKDEESSEYPDLDSEEDDAESLEETELSGSYEVESDDASSFQGESDEDEDALDSDEERALAEAEAAEMEESSEEEPEPAPKRQKKAAKPKAAAAPKQKAETKPKAQKSPEKTEQ